MAMVHLVFRLILSDKDPMTVINENRCNNFAMNVLTRRLNGWPYSPRESHWSSECSFLIDVYPKKEVDLGGGPLLYGN